MKTASEILTNASQSVRDLNPLSIHSQINKTRSRATGGRGKGHSGRSMNKTEAEFALILEAMKRKGEILRYEYEGITLRWADMKYTPDFIVFGWRWEHAGGIRLIEVKGAFVGGKFGRAVERFRHARTYWPEFQFEMHQKTKQGWKRIY